MAQLRIDAPRLSPPALHRPDRPARAWPLSLQGQSILTKLGRFLQTDPIGYEDQVNLYAYVGNDPVNFRDPTGLQCAANKDAPGYTCTLDDTTGLTKAQITQINEAYTSLVNELMAAPGTIVDLGVIIADNGTELTISTTAGEIGGVLIDSKLVYGGNHPKWNASHRGGQTTLYNNGIKQGNRGTFDREALMSTLAHEGGHGTSANDKLRRGFPSGAEGFDLYNSAHQRSFKETLPRLRRQRAIDYNRAKKRGVPWP